MALTIYAQLRLTHKYVGTHQHLDQWGEEFQFKKLAGKQVRQGNGFDDLGAVRYRVIGSKKLDQDKQAQALRDSYTHWGCSHEYDCCGCASHSARVTKVKRGVFSMLISTSRNY